jgi:hypothetical protein
LCVLVLLVQGIAYKAGWQLHPSGSTVRHPVMWRDMYLPASCNSRVRTRFWQQTWVHLPSKACSAACIGKQFGVIISCSSSFCRCTHCCVPCLDHSYNC